MKTGKAGGVDVASGTGPVREACSRDGVAHGCFCCRRRFRPATGANPRIARPPIPPGNSTLEGGDAGRGDWWFVGGEGRRLGTALRRGGEARGGGEEGRARAAGVGREKGTGASEGCGGGDLGSLSQQEIKKTLRSFKKKKTIRRAFPPAAARVITRKKKAERLISPSA